MPRLFIHIGTPKTGSTAIQYFLSQNFHTLRERGLNFVRRGRRREAHNLVLQARRAGEMDKMMARIVGEIERRPTQTHVLTSELYFGANVAQELADALPEDLRRDTKIVAYLRRQDKFLEALYKQRVKTGRYHGHPMPFARDRLDDGDYLQALNGFAAAFGQENLIVRPFERRHFPDGNIVRDAAGIFGVTQMDDLFIPGSVDNLTLSVEITQLLARLGRTTDINIKNVIRHLSHDPPADAARSGDCFSLEERREIMGHFLEMNETLHRTYCPESDSLFDERDLAPGMPDPAPDAVERLRRMERAQEIVFDTLEEMNAQAKAKIRA